MQIASTAQALTGVAAGLATKAMELIAALMVLVMESCVARTAHAYQDPSAVANDSVFAWMDGQEMDGVVLISTNVKR